MTSPLATARTSKMAAERVGFRSLLRRRLIGGALALIVAMALLVAVGVIAPMAQQAARASFDSVARETDARLRASFGSTQAALQVFGHGLQALPPSADNPTSFVERARLAMAAMPLVTSVVAGNGAGQGWLLLWRPEQREWLVRITDRTRWGDEQRFLSFDAQWRPLREWREQLPYDPRTRPWYRLAQEKPGEPRWTTPYVLFTTREPGVTVTLGWHDADGLPWAVGFDLRANEIDALAKTLTPSAHGLTLVADASGQVLGQSFAPLTLTPTPEGSWRLPRLDEVGQPLLRQAIEQGGQVLDGSRWAMPGLRWLVVQHTIVLGELPLTLWMAAPWWDFVPGLTVWLAALVGFGIAVSLAAAWIARRAARQLAEPLEYLAQAAQAVGQLSLAQPIRTDWRTREVHALARAMNESRRRLRIYQRRLQRREAQLRREVLALTAAEQRLLHVGLHDPLTDLPNRRLLLERIEHALARADRHRSMTAVLYVDLDHFKEINDEWGHEAGDALLVEVAQRLRAQVRGGDTVARLGGDEFVLVLEDVTADIAAERAHAVLVALQNPIDLGGRVCHISASIGIALAPRDGLDAVTLLRHADEAMYRAKTGGRGRVVAYEAGFSHATHEARAMREALAQAIAERTIELWWQPQVDLQDGRIVAAEGLLRWQHPQWGWVSPSTFIPLAEDGGLMERLGLLVLDLALEHGQRLDAAGWTLGRLAVNVSPRQLQVERFVDEVLSRLTRSGWPAHRLELEITESVLLDSEPARDRLRVLEARGVRLAVDDFGTGYASMAYLRALPLDTIKIDGSFVRDIGTSAQADALVESLIQLGRAVGLELVAEGVETVAQRDFLAERGVRRAQGYLWAPACPLSAWLAVPAGQMPKL